MPEALLPQPGRPARHFKYTVSHRFHPNKITVADNIYLIFIVNAHAIRH
jgi:hypothetical protein